MIVWMSTLTREHPYHSISGTSTICGRFIGERLLPPKHGYVLDLTDAVKVYGATLCVTCEREHA